MGNIQMEILQSCEKIESFCVKHELGGHCLAALVSRSNLDGRTKKYSLSSGGDDLKELGKGQCD